MLKSASQILRDGPAANSDEDDAEEGDEENKQDWIKPVILRSIYK